MSISCFKYFDYWGKTQKLEEGMHLGCKCKETGLGVMLGPREKVKSIEWRRWMKIRARFRENQ